MIEVVAAVLVPMFALTGFAIGCLMSRGDVWPTRPLKEDIFRLKRQISRLQDEYNNLHDRYSHQTDLLKQYQTAYLPPPKEFQTIIQEEPDEVLVK